MVELKKDEAKKDLDKMMAKSRAEVQKTKEAQMSEEEKKKADEAKVEAEKKKQEAEAQAAKDAEILKKEDKDISDEDKKRKTELLDKQKKAEDAKLAPEVLKIKEETQKRIDEISNNLLQLKDKSSKEAEELRNDLKIEQDKNKALEDKIAAPPTDDINSIIKKEEEARAAKYLDEDKDKSREQRREMSEEEWDAWFLEEPRKATSWESRQENRRTQERQHIHLGLTVKEIKANQGDSVGRVWVKHPELNTLKREAELKAEGKDVKEIHDILCKENNKYKVFHENLAKRQEKYSYAKNLPELVMADMEKQLNAGPVVDEKQEAIDTLTKQVENLTADIQKLQLGDTGINSNLGPVIKEGETTEAMKQYEKTAKEMKLPQERIDAHLKQMRESRK